MELFIKGDEVVFSEVSPRPHDKGMVTMISQDLSEFALHVRAFLGLPIPEIRFYGPSASRALVGEGETDEIIFEGVEKALEIPSIQMRIFGKPKIEGHRRVGVLLATANDIDQAIEKVNDAYSKLSLKNCKLI